MDLILILSNCSVQPLAGYGVYLLICLLPAFEKGMEEEKKQSTVEFKRHFVKLVCEKHEGDLGQGQSLKAIAGRMCGQSLAL